MTAARRVGLVTGANRSICREIVHQRAAHDIHVIVAARNADQAHQTAAELAELGYAASARLDVAEPGAADDAVERIIAEHARIDILVNNAGISDGDQRSSTADLELASHVWQVNVLGAWQCAKAVIPAMREAGYGRIVNMSSTLGSLHHMDRATEPAYRVSKAALNALTRVLAADLAGTGILVNSASPAGFALTWAALTPPAPSSKAPTPLCGSPPSPTTVPPVASSMNANRWNGDLFAFLTQRE